MNLVGTWRLLSFHTTIGEEIFYPLGQNALGYIMYSADGYISVAFMSGNRPNMSSNDLRQNSIEEKADAMSSYFSYCGTYQIQNGKVYHHIEVSLFPNWINQVQERSIHLDGNILTLSTLPLLVDGREQVGFLVWERVSTTE